MALKRDLAGWLDAKLTEIERRHSLDEKNSALLRAMAVKRFSKYSRATAGVSRINFIYYRKAYQSLSVCHSYVARFDIKCQMRNSRNL